MKIDYVSDYHMQYGFLSENKKWYNWQMDWTERFTKQTTIKYNVSFIFFIFLPTHPNEPKFGHQEHLHPHCFIHHQNHLEGCCICNLFHSVLFRWFENFPWLQWMDSSNPVHHDSWRVACCLWHPHTSVEHLLPCTESHQVTQVEQDRLQQWLVYKFYFESTSQKLWYLFTHFQYLHNRLLSTTWFEDEPEACVAED